MLAKVIAASFAKPSVSDLRVSVAQGHFTTEAPHVNTPYINKTSMDGGRGLSALASHNKCFLARRAGHTGAVAGPHDGF